jgi:hypothetical protein
MEWVRETKVRKYLGGNNTAATIKGTATSSFTSFT